MTNFDKQFEALTGNPPFPWQRALYEEFKKGPEAIPSACDIPTGLGKTSVIAVWLLARAENPKLPRRLVYVVNRRTVVDQTTAEVEKYREKRPELAVSTLRGQFADNREWSADPSRTAVICGTVDMIGSRLLFNGYGVGFKSKPLHAGFLGQDVLIVHDEAHLEPAFQDLLIAIETEQRKGRFPDLQPIRVMELTATSRGSDIKPPLKLQDEDHKDPVVKQRIHATKTLQFHKVENEKTELAEKLAKLALDHKDSGQAILIFVRTVEDLGKIMAKLPKERARQLTGTMRGFEREALIGDSIFKRFLPKPERRDSTVYLVCTSAGEVGVNISADHLVCDLSTFESMAQRFGRVNRFGLCDNTRIDVVHPEPSKFDEKDKLSPARRKTLELLGKLEGNASPDALSRKLSAAERLAAFAPTPTILPTSDILFDAWAMTSIQDKLPGRPKVEPYLHGIADWEPPQTQVAWREEVGVMTGDMFNEHDYPPKELLEAFPLKPHELLTDRTTRVWKELATLAERFGTRPVWIVDTDGKVEHSITLATLAGWESKQAEARLKDQIVLLPRDVGGLTPNGLLDGKFPLASKPNETPIPIDPIDNDVADKLTDGDGALRVRQWRTADEEEPKTPPGMKPVMKIVFKKSQEDDAEIEKVWHWFVRLSSAETDARSRCAYELQPHMNDAKAAAEGFVENLSLEPEIRNVVVLACQFHDLGKDREHWQRGIGNREYPEKKLAKSGKRLNGVERSSYRHEFGSVLDVQDTKEFKALSEDGKELLLHLIAAHHGRARPHFSAEEVDDDKHPPDDVLKLSIEVPRRFARLQRKFGRWGLAYLESLVRAADYAASAKADREGGQK